jgi:predicted Zn-dependent protease with MMP-like domain
MSRKHPASQAPDRAIAAAQRARGILDGDPEVPALERAVRLCARALASGLPRPLAHDLFLLQGMALNRLARPADALERLEQAAALFPDSLEAALERAVALFELCRFEDAERLFDQVARSEPSEAWAHHHLGLLAERRGDARAARSAFARACREGPDDVPVRLRLSTEAFEAAVATALSTLPARLQPFLAGVPLEIEPWPPLEDLLAAAPPLSPSILGVFRGPPLGLRGARSIALFRHNLERSAKALPELIEQIAITLLHEVGHLIGLNEAELCRRGLD